jgi:hypothetical protein
MEIIDTLRHAERSFAVVFAEALACDVEIFRGFATEISRQTGFDLPQHGRREVDLRPNWRTLRNGWDIRLKLRGDRGPVICLIALLSRYDSAAATLSRSAAREMENGAETGGRVATVWVAPKESIAELPRDREDYDAVLPMEAVIAALTVRARRAEGEPATRLRFQLGAVEAALKAATAALETLDAQESPFIRSYLHFLESRGVGLPTERAKEATLGRRCPMDIRFDPEALPRWRFMPPAHLTHHLIDGAASILIEGWSADVEELADVMEPTLRGTGYALAPARLGPSQAISGVMIVQELPPLDPIRPFEDQIKAAEACVAGLVAMRDWFARREAAARYWADCVDRDGPAFAARPRTRAAFTARNA